MRNWGTPAVPGPTLGLLPGGSCDGRAFEVPDEERSRIVAELCRREGRSFSLDEKDIVLATGDAVTALVPINDRSSRTFIGDRPLEERARLARVARGTSGSCVDYVANLKAQLDQLTIRDPTVDAFWALVVRS